MAIRVLQPLGLLAVTVLLLAACGTDSPSPGQQSSDASSGLSTGTFGSGTDGHGVGGARSSILTTAATLNAYFSAEITGRVEVVNGCVLVDRAVALFPPGTNLVDQRIILPSGNTTPLGEAADWSGGTYSQPRAAREAAGTPAAFEDLLKCVAAAGVTDVALISP